MVERHGLNGVIAGIETKRKGKKKEKKPGGGGLGTVTVV